MSTAPSTATTTDPIPPPPPGVTWSAPAGAPYATGPGPAAPPPAFPPAGSGHPGTNGLAIAALCCGIAGFIPFVAVLAIVFGIVALNQLRTRRQSGKGLAITGIVLGAIATLGWVLLVAAAVIWTPQAERDSTGAVTVSSEVFVDTLRAGDCFDGVDDGTELLRVTVRPCTEPHEAQIVTDVTLADGAYPGDDEVVDLADQKCGDTVGALILDEEIDELELSYLYPATDFDWRTDPTATCFVSASPGDTLTRSVLK